MSYEQQKLHELMEVHLSFIIKHLVVVSISHINTMLCPAKPTSKILF